MSRQGPFFGGFYRCVGLVVVALILAACGSSQQTSTDEARSQRSTDKIVMEELDAPVGGMTAYEVVQQYQPTWLRKRGRSSLQDPVPVKVYLNDSGSPYGTVSSLREIEAIDVAEIEHYTSREAQFKFGIEHVSGALMVRTKTGGE